jgi:DNA-binding CsgD family transcriptional regulator
MSERAQHYRTTGKDDLTPRQREVLQLIAAGKTNPEIAERLGITLDGAKFHVREILAKLGVDSREEAAAWWKAERGLRTRVASLLRGIGPALWWKPAAVGTAVGGSALALAAVGFGMGGGWGKDDAASATVPPPVCDTSELSWSATSAMDGDPDDGLRYVMSASAPEPCILDAVLGVSGYAGHALDPQGTFLWHMGGPIDVTVQQHLVSTVATPVIVGDAVNACNSGQAVVITLSTPAQSSYALDPPLPPCLDPALEPAFTAEWVMNMASPVPGRTVPTIVAGAPASGPVRLRTPTGTTVFCDPRSGTCPIPSVGPCSFPGCLVAAEILRDVDGFLARVESFRVSSDPPGVYSLKGGERRVLSLSQFKAEARDFLGLSPTLIAVGDAGKNGILDLVFLTDDGRAFSVAIEPRAAAPFVPIGIAHWDAVPPDGEHAETSFGTALYRRVP